MKQFVVILFLVFLVQSYSQELQTYSFEQVEQLVEKEPRPILLYFHTDWCQYCKRLQKTTFKDKKVIEKLNSNYYVISFDGGLKEQVTHKGVTYKFVPTGMKSGYHELVHHYIKKRQEIYPTLIFLDDNFKELLFIQSYISAKSLLEIL